MSISYTLYAHNNVIYIVYKALIYKNGGRAIAA